MSKTKNVEISKFLIFGIILNINRKGLVIFTIDWVIGL